ncbi:alpha/beta-hydrolase [Tothia fuscella]|uniref:Alpha/beta-hydrolase n=1 Tax=Tothia fuscella TaxID=1048955 RepID=A0A9P4U1T4_9PEZI|nr:alpha/beta-hydrolase [Tothia fuscella]
MHRTILISLATATTFLQANAQAKCSKVADVNTTVNPLVPFRPNTATFPCDMGIPIPLGKVPTGCAKFEIIVARGTSEPGDLGMIVGDPLVARVKRDMPGVDVRGYPVQYPASRNTTSAPSGAQDVQNRLIAQMKECPDEKFALVGYSQGGRVVSMATNRMNATLSKNILAVVLYGAGLGNATGSLSGITLANCAPGDIACSDSGTGAGHVSYNNEGTVWHDRTSQYIVAAFNGKPVEQKGPKLVRNPTGGL